MPAPSRGPFNITQDDERAWKALLGLVALGWFASVVAIGLAVRAADLSEHGPFEVLDKYVPLSLLGPVLIGIVAAVLVKWKSWKVGAIVGVLLSLAGAVPQHGLYTVAKSFPESYGRVVEEEQRKENFAKHHENFQRVMKECGGLVSRQWENILTDPSMASAMQPRVRDCVREVRNIVQAARQDSIPLSEDGDEQDVEDALRVAIDVQEELLAFLNRTKDSWRLVGRQVEFNDPTLAEDFNRIMAKAPRR